MQALIYLALIVLIVWAGFTYEEAQAPAPTAETPSASEPVVTPPERSPVETDIEVVTEATPKATQQAPTVDPEPTPNAGVTYDEAYIEQLELAVHSRVNDERINQGLKVLAYNELLAEVAAYHSTDMAKNDYFAHEDSEGCDSSCRVTAAGYKWRMVGENLFLLKREDHFSADGASAIVVAGWMGSEGHRKNLFEEDFTEEGIGVVIKGDTIYVTEVFGRPR